MERTAGGAWLHAATVKARELNPTDTQAVGAAGIATGLRVMMCADAACKNGARVVGMVLQQSRPWCPCIEQCMELQHFVACSGVVIPRQSNPYAARASATAATRIVRANRIDRKTRIPRTTKSRWSLRRLQGELQYTHLTLNCSLLRLRACRWLKQGAPRR